MLIRVFGGVDLLVDGEIHSVGGPRQRRLLALLCVRARQVVDVDWLSEYLWNDADRPDSTKGALRTYVSRLRSALPPGARDWVVTESGGYRLDVPATALESELFVSLRKQARLARESGDPERARRLLDQALELWRGAPFRELEDLDWMRSVVERLEIDRLEMLEERWETALDLGRHTQITGELAAFTAEHGHRDRAARQYALALHRSGRTTEALRVIEGHRRSLSDSGLEPSTEMLELEDAILAGDASLDHEAGGTPLRGYRLVERVGAGAFAVVWRAVQPSVDRPVAIKQIREELAKQPDFIRRFELEAQMVARIEHPHIVPLIDFWRDPDAAYLVMRWLPGGTLERRLDDGPLTVGETLAIADQVGAALAAAHAQSVVHRDVKSANVMFDDAGNAFLTDFGIALAEAESSGPASALSTGSPAYAAPEQLRREPLGPAADVYSLAVVVFECLTGSTPFADTADAAELLDRQLNARPPLDDIGRIAGSHVASALERALEKSPDDRFASVEEFLDALRANPVHVDPVPIPAGTGSNPYIGLRAFDEADADRYFGRERLVTELLERLGAGDITSRALVVVGPSGSGKSSVVRAGLVPRLRRGDLEGSETWFTTTMIPGSNPFEALEAALLRVAVNPPSSLLEQLEQGPRGILRGLRRCLPSDRDVLLLAIDQFEEVFLGRAASLADGFLHALSVAVTDPSSPLRLVATLRADYYHRPLEHPAFAPILKVGAVEVTPLAPDELEEAIVGPARASGVEFEPGLVARIAAESLGQASPLPLLQHVLSELYEQRDDRTLTLDAYERIGGVSGALAARAESIFQTATETQRHEVRRVFGEMVDPEEHRNDLRRRVLLTDLGDEDATRWVLEQFSQARLLTFDRDSKTREPTVEVAHEAILREWPRVAEWLEEDRAILRVLERLRAAAGAWDESGRQPSDLLRGGRLADGLELMSEAPKRLRPLDRSFLEASLQRADAEVEAERRRVQRLRVLIAVVSFALVAAVLAGGVALVQRNQAESATAEAQAATAEAESASAQARAAESAAQTAREEAEFAALISQSEALIGEEPDVAILLALEAHRRIPGSESDRAVLAALAAAPGRISTVELPERDPVPCAAFDDPMLVSASGHTGFTVNAGRLVTVDFDTGRVEDHGPAPAPCVQWIGDQATDVRWVSRASATNATNLTDGSGTTFWRGTWDGPLVEVAIDDGVLPLDRGLIGEWLMVAGRDSGLLVVDAATTEVVGKVTGASIGLTVFGLPWAPGDAVTVDPSSGVAIVSLVEPGPEPFNAVTIANVTTGDTRRVRLSQPATSVAIDNGLAFLGGLFGEVTTIDVATGEIVANVQTSSASEISAIGVRPDGRLAAVTDDEVMLVDRRQGTIGPPVAIDVGSAVVRLDGSVLVVSAGQATASVVSLEETAIVEQWIDGVGGGSVGFGHGMAAVVKSDQTIEVIDLETGEPHAAGLGEDVRALAPVAAFPTQTGLVVFGADGTIVRIDDGNIVETVTLGRPDRSSSFAPADWAGVDAAPGASQAVSAGSLVVYEASGEVAVAHTIGWTESLTIRPFEVGFDPLTAVAAVGGGIHVLSPEGLLRTYDVDRGYVGEIRTGVRFPILAAGHDTGVVAVGGLNGGVLVEPETGAVSELAGAGVLRGLNFSSDGSQLVGVRSDGAVGLWDVGTGEMIGNLWTVTNDTGYSAPWFDTEKRTVWVTSGSRLLELHLEPGRWIERACGFVGRDLTSEEWDRYVPGDGPVHSACS